MKKKPRNFHVPLPDDLYGRLRDEARRREVPATQMVREAIEVWLNDAEREALLRDISEYAHETAGTGADLDEGLEEAGLEHLGDEEEFRVKRGDLYWADLAPRSGSEQRGRRPVIVVSHDGFNRVPAWRSVIVVPVTTSARQRRPGPTAVPLKKGAGGLSRASTVLGHQITTIDRAKLTRRIGTLAPSDLSQVEQAICAAIDLR